MTVDAADRGFLLGDGLFETLLARDGALVDFEAHAARLRLGCAALGLPTPTGAALQASAIDALSAAGLMNTRAAVRLTWTAGTGGRGLDRPELVCPQLIASAASAPAPEGPVSLATVDIRRNATSPAAHHKTLAYLDNVLARRAARAAGADEALMLNTDGEICGAAAANIFWFEGDALVTPALACGVLPGTMRARVIARATVIGLAVRQASATLRALDVATGVFITNSLIGLRAVSRVDGREVEADARTAVLLADVA